jgi:hypothetical protein
MHRVATRSARFDLGDEDGAGPVIIPYDSSWPLWARVLITVFALGLFAVLAWRYCRWLRR